MLFVDNEMARRIEYSEAHISMENASTMARLHPESDAEVEQIAGGWAGFCGAESPLTQAIGLGMEGPVSEDDIDRLEDFYRSRGAAVRLILSPMADPSLVEMINRRGYRLAEFENVLVNPLDEIEPSNLSPGLELTRVGLEDADLWVNTVARGFSEGGEIHPVIMQCMPLLFHINGAECYLARVDGEAAGGAGMAIHEGVAAVFGAATLVEFRNRGIQSALLRRRLEVAKAAGCDFAVVCTKPGSVSQRNVQRQGFRVAYTKAAMVMADNL
jgi:GNAT superfamily N-acetyltransferase